MGKRMDLRGAYMAASVDEWRARRCRICNDGITHADLWDTESDRCTRCLEEKDDLHVLPDFPGERKHLETQRCWCSPDVEQDGLCAPMLVIHHRRAEA